MTNFAALPGPGDTETFPLCANHPNDPRTPSVYVKVLRAAIENDLRNAVIRCARVDWGWGSSDTAARSIDECGSGDEDAETAFVGLHAAIANGAGDQEIAALARGYCEAAFKRCVDDMLAHALDGGRITFPKGVTR